MSKFLTLILATSLLVGCATTSKDQKLQQVVTAVQLASYTGTTIYLQKHPEQKNAFVLSRDILNSFIKDGKYDPASLHKALEGLPIKELKGENGAIIITSAQILYESYVSGLTDLDKTPALKAIMTAVRDGFDKSLSQ